LVSSIRVHKHKWGEIDMKILMSSLSRSMTARAVRLVPGNM
jgi:hypothetical protein